MRLFKPLVYTYTFSLAAAALLSVTLAPVLMQLFVRGRIVPERRNPLNRALTVTQGFGSSQPLLTTYSYSALGDLACVQLPAGNALAYTYDPAGRLASVARQASCGAAQRNPDQTV